MQQHLLSWSQDLFLPMQQQHLLICTCMCSLQRHYGAHKADQIDAAHKVLSHYNEGNEYEPAMAL